jgi:Asp-tRNA(Asn)/Glu-tRNA(Gln) amidotransferase A subunit family amidase
MTTPLRLTLVTMAAITGLLLGDPTAATPFELSETSISAVHMALQTKEISCRSLIDQYLKRIHAFDQPTRLNAIVTVNPDATREAERLDTNFKRTGKLKPLHCVPVIVKDNYETRGLQTTGGSLALKGWLPETDATMVAQLRTAGAVILAKSNMAEWAFSPYLTESSIAGITRNPYNLEHVPAGSSGGTAAAVAANFGLVGLGTDTGNSIRGPSSHNALVGLRPTLGLTSRHGIVPLFVNNDVGGPMTRSVTDAATVLNVIAEHDPADPLTARSSGHIPADYRLFLERNGLVGVRIGVFRRYVDAATGDPEIRALTERAIADLRAAGAEIVDPFGIDNFDTLTQNLWCGDFESDLDHYLAARPNAPVHSLSEVYRSGLYLPHIESELKQALAPAAVDERRAPCPDVWSDEPKIAFRDALTAAMTLAHVDVIIYPTWSNPPRRVGDNDSPPGDNSQILSPQTGWPAITVPMGYSHTALPAGLTFLGPAYSEGLLLRYAYAYEQATHHRKPPDGFGLAKRTGP